MRFKYLQRIGFLLLGLSLLGCGYSGINGDSSFVSLGDSEIPVVILGDLHRSAAVLYIHGGPGGSSFIDLHNGFFDRIAEEYVVVCYDQRASGNSVGYTDDADITLDQYVEDLDTVVDYVNYRMDSPSIFLLGHSWGGMLGTAYLLEADKRAKVSGWIEVDGGHNMGRTAFEASRDFVLAHTAGLPSSEVDAIESFYLGIDSWRAPEDVITHSTYVRAVGGYFYDPAKGTDLFGMDTLLGSESDFIAFLQLNEHVIRHMDVWYLDFTPRLSEINLPTMILWGRHDGILPVELGIQARDAMGLTADDFYIFENSSHSPHYEENAAFSAKVISFIQRSL